MLLTLKKFVSSLPWLMKCLLLSTVCKCTCFLKAYSLIQVQNLSEVEILQAVSLGPNPTALTLQSKFPTKAPQDSKYTFYST